MGKFERGFRMVRASCAVLAQRPDAVLLALGGIVASLAVSGASAWLLYRAGVRPGGRLEMSLLFGLVVGAGALPVTLTNFAVTVIADGQMRGYEPTVRESLRVTFRKLPRILGWTALSLTVGAILRALTERLPLGGVVASWLVGLAWGLATTFVIPILVIEDLTVSESIRRSAATFKKHWGPTFVAQAGVGVLALVVLLPLVVFFMVAMPAAVARDSTAFFVTMIVVLWVAVVVVGSIIAVLQSVVNVALYQFAASGLQPREFSRADLAGAFQPKKGWFGGA